MFNFAVFICLNIYNTLLIMFIKIPESSFVMHYSNCYNFQCFDIYRFELYIQFHNINEYRSLGLSFSM